MSHDQPVAAQPAGEPTGPILSPAEAGILLRASPESLRRWRNQRTGPRYARIGRRIVYFRSDLLAFAEEQREQAMAAAADPHRDLRRGSTTAGAAPRRKAAKTPAPANAP